jgi:hypothetical protein
LKNLRVWIVLSNGKLPPWVTCIERYVTRCDRFWCDGWILAFANINMYVHSRCKSMWCTSAFFLLFGSHTLCAHLPTMLQVTIVVMLHAVSLVIACTLTSIVIIWFWQPVQCQVALSLASSLATWMHFQFSSKVHPFMQFQMLYNLRYRKYQ